MPDDVSLEIVTPRPADAGCMIPTPLLPDFCGLSITRVLPQATDLSCVFWFPPQAVLSSLSLCVIICFPSCLGAALSLARLACGVFFGFVAFPVVVYGALLYLKRHVQIVIYESKFIFHNQR